MTLARLRKFRPRRRGPDQRIADRIEAGDLEQARAEVVASLSAEHEWTVADLARIKSYVRARNDGVPLHRLPVPPKVGEPDGESQAVIEPSDYTPGAFDVMGDEPPHMAGLRDGRTRHRPGIRVWSIPDATVLHVRGAFLVKDVSGATVADCSGRGSDPLEDLFDPIIASKAITEVDGRALLLLDGTDSGNYCHWITNQLTRLAIYQRAGLTPATLLLDCATAAYHLGSLEATADLHTDVVEMRDAPLVRLRELVVASNVGHDFRHPAHKAAPWAIDFLRQRLVESDATAGPEFVYVSRADASARHVLNEHELMAALAPRGFVEVSLVGMAVSEQASLFAGARAIVSAHGAGLANLAFCRRATQVLEIFPGSIGTPAFCLIAVLTGQAYTALGAQAVPNPANAYGIPDIRVDVAAVEHWADEVVPRRHQHIPSP